MKCGTQAVQFLLGFTLIGCGPETFVVIGPLSDAADSGAIVEEAGDEASRQDADAHPDAPVDSKPTVDAAPDAPCDVGVQACLDVETLYCARMKSCCNGMCANSWQNNGGSECMMRFNNASCTGKMICENACIADIQAATCTTVKSANGPASISSGCMSLY